MRNMKKFLALVLAMLMVCSMAVMTTSAAEEGDYTDAAQHLAALKIMKGNENGDLMMEAGVTRYQTALFFAQAVTGKTDAAVWNAEKKSVNFADVIDYGTAIDYAAGLNIVKGRGNGVFGYNDAIIYQDMIVMAIRALGYETADMQYPYGHILAAQKLDLLENIDLVNYKAELKRGETAQLIWNMLNTEIAVVDPLTEKVIYPGEEDASLAGAISDKLAEQLKDRVTLLEDAGFADGKAETFIELFTEADEDDEESVDMITLGNGWEIAAADLGITAETAKVTYLGLPVTVFVDCDADDFQAKYDDEEATVVFADFEEYTAVVNVADQTNIRLVVNADDNDRTYLSLNGTKFANKDYSFIAKAFIDDENGWVSIPTDFVNDFEYTTKDGYVSESETANTYAQIAYRVIEILDDPETENVDEEESIVEMLYTPFSFGQYITRELKYTPTGDDETFTIIGTFAEGANDPITGDRSDIAEKFVGSNASVTKSGVTKSKGEAAMTVTLAGEAVQNGDFMFYAYNELDNVLTVAQNCGTFATGRMTKTSTSKETVTIGGTAYEFGFAGLFGTEAATYDKTTVDTLIKSLEAGKDNVKYLAVDGGIVYMTDYEGAADAASYGFAILTNDVDTMTDLLGITETKYNNALVDGLYVEDGYVVLAGLDVATGKWELVKVEAVALTYDTEEEEFTDLIDVATLAKYTTITSSLNQAAEYAAAQAILGTYTAKDDEAGTKASIAIGGMFAVVEAEDDVYTIADIDTTVEGEYLVDRSAENAAGLVFNSVGKTNEIKATADEDVDAARVATGENTVIVVLAADGIQVRTGVQSAKKSIEEAGVFFAADSALIVMTTDAEIGTWGKGSAVTSDETYYIALPEFGLEYGTVEEDETYTLTIEGLYDLKTLEMADAIVVEGDTMEELEDVADLVTIGALLHQDEDGTLTAASDIAAAMAEILGDDYFVATVEAFKDTESITVKDGNVVITDAAKAIVETAVTVITLDLTEYDWDEANLDTMYVGNSTNVPTNEDGNPVSKYSDVDVIELGSRFVYNYVLDMEDTVVEITDPTDGVYNQFVIDMAGKNIKVQDADADENVYDDNYNFTTELYTVAAYDDDAEVMTLYVVKLVK